MVKKYYYAGPNRVAMTDDLVSRTLLGDHLGSTAVTVAGTSELGEVRYKAFGASRFTSGTTPTTFRYTGQREEASFGLYYYGARWYDPALGHFVQPDTIVPNAADARAYDRYAYVLNNPLRYNDPSGHCASVLAAAAAGGFSVPVAIVVDSGCLATAASAVVATGGTVAVGAVLVYGYVHSTDELPTIPPIQPEVLQDSGFTVSIPVPGSTTVTSGVPLVPGDSTADPGFGAISNPGINIVDPPLQTVPQQNVTYAKGGTYLQKDPITGQIMRTGRTKDLARREREHQGSGLDFEVDRRTDDYAAQRGREQLIHDQHNPPLNRIRPINPRNPNRENYLRAGRALDPN